jgi:phosphoglucomutase
VAGDAIEAKLTKAPNGAALGGIKVVTKRGWFAARPSGTEKVYKLYAESYVSEDHLRRLQNDARDLLTTVLRPNQ